MARIFIWALLINQLGPLIPSSWRRTCCTRRTMQSSQLLLLSISAPSLNNFLKEIPKLTLPFLRAKTPLSSLSLPPSMTTPNMATITAALERSLQNCSLSSSPSSAHSPRPPNQRHDETPASSLELNSHLALPYEWEQCLDLKVARNAHLSLINATLFFFWWLVFKAHVKILSFLICLSFITLLALFFYFNFLCSWDDP